MRSHRLGAVLRANALPLGVGVASLAAGLLVGYIVFGTSLSESFEADPGIPPPEYLYLDNARVLAFLAQIEGGLSDRERRTRSVTRRVDARVSGSGGEAGGSSEELQFVEEVVTPTATTRFYRLLDRLRDKGYLTELDAADRSLASDLLEVQEGAFVRISGCRLELPNYMQLYRLYESSGGAFGVSSGIDDLTPTEKDLLSQISRDQQGPFLLQKLLQHQTLAANRRDTRRYVRTIGSNPRVPLSSCVPRSRSKAAPVDFLFPIQYAVLSDEQSLLSGALSIVGKVIRIARPGDRDHYQDPEALRTFLAATYQEWERSLVVQATIGSLGGEGRNSPTTESAEDRWDNPLAIELVEDATVFAPGAVILPIAIYK